MREPYLEVTFRRGRPIVAYLYLPRHPGDTSHRTLKIDPGMIVDFNEQGTPIGIEIVAPSIVTAADINRALGQLGQPGIANADLAPLRAA